jgi:putative nucleotidyltransferase with HDIG domain
MADADKMTTSNGRLPLNMGGPRMQTSDDRHLTGQAQVSIELIVAKTGDLPPIPTVALKALKMSEDPEVDIQELQATLTQDQALTAQILRIANSSLYCLEREIATVSHAVAILGLDTIRFTLSAACVQQVFNAGKNPSWPFGNKRLTDHSWGTALCGRAIARKVGYAEEEEALLAGLMHDIGKAVLLKNLPGQYIPIADDVHHGEITFYEAELVVFGFSHAHVGATLAERWGFPPQLVEAIGFHHDPEAASNQNHKQLAYITALANKVTTFLGFGFEAAATMALHELPAAKLLGLDLSAIDAIVADTNAALQQMPETLKS